MIVTYRTTLERFFDLLLRRSLPHDKNQPVNERFYNQGGVTDTETSSSLKMQCLVNKKDPHFFQIKFFYLCEGILDVWGQPFYGNYLTRPLMTTIVVLYMAHFSSPVTI